MSDSLGLKAPVAAEYKRWMSLIGRADPYVGKVTIGIHEALQAHFLLVDFFVSANFDARGGDYLRLWRNVPCGESGFSDGGAALEVSRCFGGERVQRS